MQSAHTIGNYYLSGIFHWESYKTPLTDDTVKINSVLSEMFSKLYEGLDKDSGRGAGKIYLG